jgi:lipoprotein-releasing system permease protein
MALVIALALMTGLQQELRDRILGSSAHVYVWKPGGMDRLPGRGRAAARSRAWPGAAPAMLGKALVTSPRGEGFITVKGSTPRSSARSPTSARSMTAGASDAHVRRR